MKTPRYTEYELLANAERPEDRMRITVAINRAEAARAIGHKATNKTQRDKAKKMKAFALEHGFKA